jgi:LPXTG-site transpeptidase (sortase) family protein
MRKVGNGSNMFLHPVITLGERLLLTASLCLLSVYGAALLHSRLSNQYDLWAFEQARHGRQISWKLFLSDMLDIRKSGQVSIAPDLIKPENSSILAAHDQTTRSQQRKCAYQLAEQDLNGPLAKLEIPSLHLVAMVLEGTDVLTLNRGLGHIEGTSLPGKTGNVGIAGHRDGSFRKLVGIAIGDLVSLTTRDATFRYRVQRTAIVDASDISVLEDQHADTLTLITCYPIYFIGPAPRRLVVTAQLEEQRLNLGPLTIVPVGLSCIADMCAIDTRELSSILASRS